MIKSYIVNGQIRSLMNAEEYSPTEQEWLWAVSDTEFNRKHLHSTFGELYLFTDRYNLCHWVPRMSTLRIELPTSISVKILGSVYKDTVTFDGVKYTGYSNAMRAMIGWLHPNRENIFKQYLTVEQFDWSQLRLVDYVNRGNAAKHPVFEYRGTKYQTVKKLCDTFGLKPEEVKERMGVKERDYWIAMNLKIKKAANTKAVYFAGGDNKANFEKIFKTPTELLKGLRSEGFGTTYKVAKKIFDNVIKGTYKYD